jgi:hypothetical protein
MLRQRWKITISSAEGSVYDAIHNISFQRKTADKLTHMKPDFAIPEIKFKISYWQSVGSPRDELAGRCSIFFIPNRNRVSQVKAKKAVVVVNKKVAVIGCHLANNTKRNSLLLGMSGKTDVFISQNAAQTRKRSTELGCFVFIHDAWVGLASETRKIKKRLSGQEGRFKKAWRDFCSADFSRCTSEGFRLPATVGFLRPRLASSGFIQRHS